jgi:hypothetical protein
VVLTVVLGCGGEGWVDGVVPGALTGRRSEALAWRRSEAPAWRRTLSKWFATLPPVLLQKQPMEIH